MIPSVWKWERIAQSASNRTCCSFMPRRNGCAATSFSNFSRLSLSWPGIISFRYSEVRLQPFDSPARTSVDCENSLHDCFYYSAVVSTASSGGAKSTGGFVERVIARAVRKLRQRSSGIAATHMSASWLTMKPTSQGKAFCMKP
jgi:hypothetical protein